MRRLRQLHRKHRARRNHDRGAQNTILRLPHVRGERRETLRNLHARRRASRLAARGGARARLRQNIYIRPAQRQKRARGARNDGLPHRRGIFAGRR